MTRATVFAPASVGNVGPGFDVLGLAVEGLGDQITIELTSGPSRVDAVIGRHADSIPREPEKNCAVVAALSLLKRIGDKRNVILTLDRSLPVSGGLGASAAASVGGAFAAVLASGKNVDQGVILQAALDGEESVAGRHLDNIAPCLLGGVTLVRDTYSADVFCLPLKGEWWVAVVSPDMQLSTKKARSVLTGIVNQGEFVAQMANTSALVASFMTGNHELARRSLVDHYAEPRRAPLIPGFANVKKAALAAGALGCSISGAGPTLFALAASKAEAQAAAEAMIPEFLPMTATSHVGRVATRGAYAL